MAPVTSHQLAELSATLRAQLPILFSFAVIRWLVWSSAACVCAPCIPQWLWAVAERARRALMAAGTLSVFALAFADPPPLDQGVCADYAIQRAQGATALLSVAVLAMSNRVLASALAVSALKGVSDLTSASVPLALSAGYVACNVKGETLTYLLLLTYTLAHAVGCHSDLRPERTHATVLASICLSAHLATRAWLAVCCCPLRALRRPKLPPPPRPPPLPAKPGAPSLRALPAAYRLAVPRLRLPRT